MLDKLIINNFALISQCEIAFGDGFNVLVGETGAGKSIVIDAITFVLGAKSDKTFIRSGENEMRVEAIFSHDADDSKLNKTVEDLGIETDGVLIISRSLNVAGKSDIRINGRPATLSMLKMLGEQLINVFGQNESVTLLAEKNHIDILDGVVGAGAKELRAKLATVQSQIKKLNENMNSFGGDKTGRLREIELLKFQIDEIESINPKIGEDEEIKETLRMCANQERVKESLNSAIVSLDGQEGAISQLKSACKSLQSANQYISLVDLSSRVESLLYEAYDIDSTLKEKTRDIILDESEINALEERNESLSTLKRKYGLSIVDVLNYLEQSNNRLNSLINSEELMKDYSSQKTALLDEAYSICFELLQMRRQVASELKAKIKTELAMLGMKNAIFDVEFLDAPKRDGIENSMTAKGFEGVRFMFSANAGESLKSLSKTISGGEMSRFMLAFKNVVSEKEPSIMFVFDEVDAGVSGEIGVAVAKRIANIARNNQVLCITHLPQVCAMADFYLKAEKQTINGKTYSKTYQIEGDKVISEIALLAGSALPTEKALDYALEIKTRADNYKKQINA